MNIMAFAHYMTKRSMDRRMGSNRKYAQLFRWELIDAYRLIRRNGLEALDAKVKAHKEVDRRIQGEKSVIRAAVRNGIKLGYTVSVYDGEAWAVRNSSSVKEVIEAIQSTDEDSIKFNKVGADGKRVSVGSIYAVYGNSAGEVIADHSVSVELETILAPAFRRQEKYAELGI